MSSQTSFDQPVKSSLTYEIAHAREHIRKSLDSDVSTVCRPTNKCSRCSAQFRLLYQCCISVEWTSIGLLCQSRFLYEYPSFCFCCGWHLQFHFLYYIYSNVQWPILKSTQLSKFSSNNKVFSMVHNAAFIHSIQKRWPSLKSYVKFVWRYVLFCQPFSCPINMVFFIRLPACVIYIFLCSNISC